MRISKLDLIAYGPFTDITLDFGNDGKGLHIIYGPNEAGKTSAMRAIYAFFFGMGRITPDAFTHSYANLKIGAELVGENGERIELIRVKKDKNSLMAPGTMETLPDSVLASLLGGVSEDTYRSLFRIGHEELRTGGEKMAKGEDSFRDTLFQASTGGRELRKLLAELELVANGMFRPRASTTSLNMVLSEYNIAQANISKLSLSYNAWKTLKASLRSKQEEVGGLKAQHQEMTALQNKLNRINNILDHVGELKKVQKDLVILKDVVILPEDFTDERKAAEKERDDSIKLIDRLNSKIESLIASCDAVEVSEELLTHETIISELHKSIAVFENAQLDLPKVKSERASAELEVNHILKDIAPEIGVEEAGQLKVGDSDRKALKYLVDQYIMRNSDLQASKKALGDVDYELRRLEEKKKSLPTLREYSGLTPALRAAERNDDLEDRLHEANTKLNNKKTKAESELHRLLPDGTSLREVPSLPVPSQETLNAFIASFQKSDQDLEKIREKIEDQQQKEEQLQLQIKKSMETNEVPSEASLEEARQRRQIGWDLIKREWLKGEKDDSKLSEYTQGFDLAEIYEGHVEEADQVADRLRREADRVSQLSGWQVECCECQKKISSLTENLSAAQKSKDDLLEEWKTSWHRSGIDPRSPREMTTWRAEFKNLVDSVGTIKELEGELEKLQMNLQQHRQGLTATLKELIPEERLDSLNFTALIEAAQEKVNSVEEIKKKHEKVGNDLASAEIRKTKAKDDLKSSESNLARWKENWDEAVSAANVTDKLAPDVADHFLQQTKALEVHLGNIEQATVRIEQMENTISAFKERVSGLLTQVAQDLVHLPPDQAAGNINARLVDMKENRKEKQNLEEQIKEKRVELEDARQGLKEAQKALDKLKAIAQCENVEDLPEAERKSTEMIGLQEREKNLTEVILSHGKGKTLEELLAEVDDVKADRVPGQLQVINQEVTSIQSEIDEKQREVGAAQKGLEDMDKRTEAIEAAQEVESCASRIQESVFDYSRHQIAAEVLRREFERYKEQRGPELERASQLFNIMTKDSFDRLIVENDEKDRPMLLGVPAGKAPITTQEMSDGARDQLYLALRLALLEHHMEKNGPLPILLDDVLVHFDDERASETLKMLHSIAEDNQMILFTHHQHLVNIAKDALGDEKLKIQSMRALT